MTRDLQSKLAEGSACRVVVVIGPPGEGKKALAGFVMRALYEKGKAPGGVWHCSLVGATTPEEVLLRLVGGERH